MVMINDARRVANKTWMLFKLSGREVRENFNELTLTTQQRDRLLQLLLSYEFHLVRQNEAALDREAELIQDLVQQSPAP
jgi:hypothetical protein